jgi:hypothetical protein
LAACYPNRTLRTSLSRDTYWFQDRPDDATLPRQFVLVVRNVYDWTEAMRRAPLYAPDHLQNRTTGESLAWSSFAQQPWTTTTDHETTTTNVTTTTTTCQLGFTPEQVVPCAVDEVDSAWPEARPLYELDANGQVFTSILALRAAKLRHMRTAVPAWWGTAMYATHVTVMRWEEGMDGNLLAQLDAATGWTHTCSDGAWRLSEDVTARRNYTADELAHLQEHVDWVVEAMVGYAPRGS